MADFGHVETWVFDLDNTLYPAECRLFAQIDARMTDYIRMTLGADEKEARRLQKHFYVRYGTTLSGLMIEHGVLPEAFLAYVHDIDCSVVPENPALRAALGSLPGRRYVFTNGSVAHAEKVLARVGLIGLIDEIFDIRAADWTPKPHRATYERFLAAHGVRPHGAAMFEDLPHNLEAAHALGMTTVLVRQNAEWFADEPADKRPARPGDPTPPHVHHVTDDLAGFLGTIETKGPLLPSPALAGEGSRARGFPSPSGRGVRGEVSDVGSAPDIQHRRPSPPAPLPMGEGRRALTSDRSPASGGGGLARACDRQGRPS